MDNAASTATTSLYFAPEQITRVLFEGFASSAIYLFYIIGIAAIVVFCHGCYVQVRKYRRGAGDTASQAQIKDRLVAMVGTVLSHRTIKRRDTGAGHAHRLIFFGFVLLFIGTATITLEYDITARLFGFKFWYGDFYLWFSLVLDLAGVGLIAGMLYMMARRGWIKPPKLDYARPDREPGDPDFDRSGYRREDWAFLWALIIIAATGFVLEAARLVWLQDRPEVWTLRWWSPVGALLAEGMRAAGLGAEGAGSLRGGLWWFHGAIALVFIALIPRTKVKHIFTASGSLMFRDPLAAQRLPKTDPDAPSVGYAKITDLTWKHLLNLDACTKCGRCHEACPARAAGAPLSPRDVILSLREFANDALEKQSLPEEAKLDIHGKDVGQVFMETLWSCRTCMACVEICPVAVEHVPIIVQMRRKLVEEGQMEPLLQKTLQTIHKTGNSFGESKRKRAAWTKGLDFPVKDARKEPVDVLWFVGDYASFDPRNQKVTQGFARLLNQAGVNFGILYEGESNAGNDVRRVGEEGLYELLAENNIATLSSAGFKRIVTTDPHSFNTIKNEYPDFGGKYEIVHYTQMVLELIREGRLTPDRKLGYRTTYHDPCHLGRFNKEYDAPRALIEAVGCELVDMARSRDNSFCCGAGGGRIWIPDPVGKDKPAQIRMKEAAQIDGLEVFAVACPKDLTMFEDALKTTGNEGRFVVRELIELIEESMAPRQIAEEAVEAV
ncbi:MAG: 4Fe-4S dicluster domain-containing protein [Gammaproteobacteria bacterium]|nr:4Fe-4S dicluster domain-containing protein [Gammaproteobacteria bacterium]MBU0770323.1 4Fe-4S dicluster domain-containing protein [Gammaproteobacteria bacterium]MBU0857182.1 4Fe-4S dicluster domain-containing protein [Gammaproteobacteria bacterium]MBU1847840.1 4Fe-4S dicluster domain-containing protein [Gammaproteobacteria bacterium]